MQAISSRQEVRVAARVTGIATSIFLVFRH
jgi:hypothetical protein